MSLEEDTELRDLISQTLQANGCFAKIRAQLRASIYLALDEDDMFQKKEALLNKKLHSALETVEGKLMFCLVREFLEHFDLEFTISVFEPESYMGLDYEYSGRCKLIEDLNLPSLKEDSSVPILSQLLQLWKLNDKLTDLPHTENSISSLNYKNDLLSHNTCNESNSIILAANDSDISNKSSSNSSLSNNILNETYDINAQHNVLNSESLFLSDKPVDVDHSKLQQDQILKHNLSINFDKNLQIESIPNKSDLEKLKSSLDHSITDTEFSPPVVKDTKHSKFDTSFEKLKLSSTKSDKIKVKNNLGSLSDLPPLQMTKSRANDMLLPSLYTKDFKDKNSTKDVDKLFELEPLDNYEEDFISENEIDLSMKSNQGEISEANSLIELQEVQAIDKNSLICENENITFNVGEKKKFYLDNNSTASSVTSEDFEINSNDDILNSC